jgi:PAS domain S-box-containing protein
VAESLRLLHEFEVHQVELEMQNAELQKTRDELETALEKYTDLYDFSPVGYFTLDHQGVIREVNLTGSSLLGIDRSQLVGRRFGLFVADSARPAFTAFLQKVFESQVKEACEVELLKGRKQKHPLFVQIEAKADVSGLECHIATAIFPYAGSWKRNSKYCTPNLKPTPPNWRGPTSSLRHSTPWLPMTCATH